jgi:hypothetical protein
MNLCERPITGDPLFASPLPFALPQNKVEPDGRQGA